MENRDLISWIEQVCANLPTPRKEGSIDLINHNEWYEALVTTITNLEHYGLAHSSTDAERDFLSSFLTFMSLPPETTIKLVKRFTNCPVVPASPA